MKRSIVLAFALGAAGLAIRRSRQRLVGSSRDATVAPGSSLRRRADALGFWAYLAAMNRGLPDKELLAAVRNAPWVMHPPTSAEDETAPSLAPQTAPAW